MRLPCPFDASYEVSSEGRIRRKKTGRILKQAKINGRPSVSLSVNANTTRFYVAHLVLAAHHRDREPGETATYHNGDKADCRASNLGWKLGRAKPKALKARPGEPSAEWIEGFICRNSATFTIRALAKFTGYDERRVSAILARHKSDRDPTPEAAAKADSYAAA